MAQITDPTVIAYYNTVIRPLANRYAGIVATMAVERAKWNDVIKPLMSENAPSDEIMDGAHADGRQVLTKGSGNKFWDVVDPMMDVVEGLEIVSLPANPNATEDLLAPKVLTVMLP